MFLNRFSVRIPQGTESSGYVELEHDTKYTLVLRNNRDVRCDARVEVDGKHVGTWRINAGSNITLERPAHDDGCFTFYRAGTKKGKRAGLDKSNPNLGLVKVTFTPEKVVEWHTINNRTYIYQDGSSATFSDSGATRCAATPKGLSAGGTGLSGKSNQQFYTVAELDYDLSQQTVIHLRLVAKNGKEPRPLTSYSTPVPPPIR